jgi:hypothetical protein
MDVDRSALRSLVGEALEGLQPVAVTHDSAADIAGRLANGFQVRDTYRPQLETFGSITHGEDLHESVFASLEFQPPEATQPVLGVERYGDVALHWNPKLLQPPTTISPIITGGSLVTGGEFAHDGGMHAGSIGDLADIVTDTLIAQHTSAIDRIDGARQLGSVISQPHEQAVAGVRDLLVNGLFHRLSPEAILRGAAPSRDAIAAISVLTSEPSPELTAIRAWAAKTGVPVLERPRATGPSA